MSSRGNKGKKTTGFNPEIPPFRASGAGASSATEDTSPLSQRQPSNTTSSLPSSKRESDPLTCWKKSFQRESNKKQDASGKELIEIFSTVLVDIQKNYIHRCDTLTAYMLALAEVKKQVVSEITHLAGTVSIFMEEVQDEFLTTVDFHHSLDSLESDMT
jgi:hypothetical protein